MDIDKEMQELFNLLDQNSDIKKIKKLKGLITDKEKELINNYRINSTLDNKKRLYNNDIIKEYLQVENNINYLIMQINSRFKRRKICQK